MLSVIVIETTGTGRTAITEEVAAMLHSVVNPTSFMAQVKLSSASPEELRFLTPPDLLILGTDLCTKEKDTLAALCKSFPKVTKLASINSHKEDLYLIEELITLGIDEVHIGPWNPARLFATITKAARGRRERDGGRIITVVGTRGGLGTTTTAAALGCSATTAQDKVVLLDLDEESRSLSRFLRIRPLFNEPLELILQAAVPLREDTISQTQIAVEGFTEKLMVIPPARECGHFVDLHHPHARILLNMLQTVHQSCDTLIIDSANARGTFLQGVLRISDVVVVAVTNDPALVPGAAEKLAFIIRSVSPQTGVVVANLCPTADGLPHRILIDEYQRLGLPENLTWLHRPIPYCSKAKRWPGSGYTPFTHAGKTYRRALVELSNLAGITTTAADSSYSSSPIAIESNRGLMTRSVASLTSWGAKMLPNQSRVQMKLLPAPSSMQDTQLPDKSKELKFLSGVKLSDPQSIKTAS